MSETSLTTAMLPGRAEGKRTATASRMVVGARLVKKGGWSTPSGQRFSEHGRRRTPRTAPGAHMR